MLKIGGKSHHGHVKISFHFINHGKITVKSRRNHGEIMKKSWSRYQIWWKITVTITSRYTIYGRGKPLGLSLAIFEIFRMIKIIEMIEIIKMIRIIKVIKMIKIIKMIR